MKKTWQKALTLLLAVCLCVGLGAGALAADAGVSLTLSVPSGEFKPGETVNVDVVIGNNPGLASIRLQVHYDSDVLTAKEANINKEAFDGTAAASVDKAGEVGFTWINIDKDIDYNGTFATITFEVNKEAKADSALYIAADQDDFYSNDETLPNEGEIPLGHIDDQTNSSVVVEVDVPHTHNMSKTEEDPSTCTKAGTAAYWTCSECKKMFSDEDGTNEIKEPQALPLKPHTLTETAEDPATCEKTGTKAYWTCSVCEKLFSDAAGTNEITEPETIPVAAHTLTETAAVPAECEKEGTEAYWTCSVCKKLFSDAQGTTEIQAPVTIPALDHDWDDGVVTKPATCTEKGIMTYTCKNDSSHIKEEDIDIDPDAHDWTDWEITKEPTDTEDGERQRSCKNHPDVIETETIPHDVLFVITFDANEGTSTVASAKTNKNGMLETLPEATRDGYNFVGWFTAKTGGTRISTSYIFKADTTVYAQWQAASRPGPFMDPKKWPDTPSFNKPTEPTNPTQPTVPTEPTQPVQPTEPAQPTLPFGDVAPDRWSYADIRFVYENGLMNGTSGSVFAPAAEVTRGMIVTILYRLEGSPAVTEACPFTDVKAGSYYEAPITWAAANGIVTGYSADRFGPDDPITREQLAAILYRYAQTKGEGFTGAWYFPLDFSDAANVSEWADEAMHWCVMNGLINGSNGSLNPAGTATREQTAAILHRFCENILK